MNGSRAKRSFFNDNLGCKFNYVFFSVDAPFNEPSKNSIDGNMQIILSSAYLGLTRLTPGFLYLNDQGLLLYTVGLCLCTIANTGSSLEVYGSV